MILSKNHGFPLTYEGKSGWPWINEIQPLPELLQDGSRWPKISIVTPSYNQGPFLEETIRSVLLQGYPNIEYMIIDGGSTDNSVEIIKKYEPWLKYWVSEPDRGQSHAINKGFERATGDIIAYLNSDDYYFPGALEVVAKTYLENPEVGAIVGSLVSVSSDSSKISILRKPFLPKPAPLDLTILDHETWHLPQQSGFWIRSVLDKVGLYLREELQYTMDREIYYRICNEFPVKLLDIPLATYRLHEDSKSISKTFEMFLEAPLAISYFYDGTRQDERRRKVGRWRIAQGQLSVAKKTNSYLDKINHLFFATYYRPNYLLRSSFRKLILKALLGGRVTNIISHIKLILPNKFDFHETK